MNGERFVDFISSCILPLLQPFNGTNPHLVVIMGNASIHHVDVMIENLLVYILFPPPPSYSPDLNPIEEVFSQVTRPVAVPRALLSPKKTVRTSLKAS